jgi:hypothetical protein
MRARFFVLGKVQRSLIVRFRLLYVHLPRQGPTFLKHYQQTEDFHGRFETCGILILAESELPSLPWLEW